jgi:pyruvate formate lyase activating enzyme
LVEIKGLEKFAPRDYPGFISATVFTGGCNFRCPYCHNADLVLDPESIESFPFEIFLQFLDTRKSWLEAVCVSGGEPLLHTDIASLFQLLKDRGLRTKLDTNGSFPERLISLIEAGLLDFVAMDVKAPWEKYADVAGTPVDTKTIKGSVDIILASGIDHVFRTTAVPGLTSPADLREICGMLQGARSFKVQAFSPENSLDPSLRNLEPFSQEDFQAYVQIAQEYFPEISQGKNHAT